MTVCDAVIEELAASEADARAAIEELQAEVTSLHAELLLTRSERDIWREMTQELLGTTARSTAHLDIARYQLRHAARQRFKAA